jgi:hypothetical protein
MRTLTITLGTAFVFLLGLQLTAASRERNSGERGASQAVVTGSLLCDPESTAAALTTDGGFGVLSIPTASFAVYFDQDGDCSSFLPALAEQFPHPICEFGNTFQNSNLMQTDFVCSGRADVVISAIGKAAKTMVQLGQF